jgi:hypothetical protein
VWISSSGPLHLATAPELARTTRRYFDETRETAIAFEPDVAKAVVQRTREALGGG